MTVLLTGGAGYIGRWLACEFLKHDIATVAFDRQAPDPASRPFLPASARFVEGDITNTMIDDLLSIVRANQ